MSHSPINAKVLQHRLYSLARWHDSKGRGQLAAQLRKQLSQLNYTGVAPEVLVPMIAHCGRWHVVAATLPMTMPCCGLVLLAQD